MPCVKYKSTPNQKLEVAESGSTLYQLCIMVASCPSIRCSCRKNQSYTEKQRVWSRSCGLQDLLRNIPISDCSMWPLQNTEWFGRLSFYPRWVVGLPAFQLPMFAKCDCRWKEESCFTCFFILRHLNLHSLPVAWCSWELVFYGLSPPLHHGHSFAAKELLSPLLSPCIIFVHRIQSTAGRIWPLIERFDRCAAVHCDSALIRWQIAVPSKIEDFAEFGRISSLCKGSW